MKIYTREYGWVYGHFDQWLRWLFVCLWRGHRKRSLGDGHAYRGRFKRGWCNSDNCDKCTFCGIESHD